MEALIKILKEFDENRENRVKCENWSSKTIEEKHKAIAAMKKYHTAIAWDYNCLKS